MEYSRALGPMLGRSAHLVRERMDARLSQYDMTPAQTHTLLYLYHHNGVSPQCEVIQHLKVKPSTANGVLDRMEEKKLLSRSVSDSDARQKLITLTEKGAKLQKQLHQAFEETERLMMEGMSLEEREMFFSRLERVIQNLKKTSGKAFGMVVINMPAMMMIVNATFIAVIWFGGKLVNTGGLLTGDLMAYFTYIMQIMMSLMMVFMIMTRSAACATINCIPVRRNCPET